MDVNSVVRPMPFDYDLSRGQNITPTFRDQSEEPLKEKGSSPSLTDHTAELLNKNLTTINLNTDRAVKQLLIPKAPPPAFTRMVRFLSESQQKIINEKMNDITCEEIEEATKAVSLPWKREGIFLKAYAFLAAAQAGKISCEDCFTACTFANAARVFHATPLETIPLFLDEECSKVNKKAKAILFHARVDTTQSVTNFGYKEPELEASRKEFLIFMRTQSPLQRQFLITADDRSLSKTQGSLMDSFHKELNNFGRFINGKILSRTIPSLQMLVGASLSKYKNDSAEHVYCFGNCSDRDLVKMGIKRQRPLQGSLPDALPPDQADRTAIHSIDFLLHDAMHVRIITRIPPIVQKMFSKMAQFIEDTDLMQYSTASHLYKEFAELDFELSNTPDTFFWKIFSTSILDLEQPLLVKESYVIKNLIRFVVEEDKASPSIYFSLPKLLELISSLSRGIEKDPTNPKRIKERDFLTMCASMMANA